MPHKRDARFIWVCYCEIWLDLHKPEKLLHVLNRDIPTLKAKYVLVLNLKLNYQYMYSLKVLKVISIVGYTLRNIINMS